MSETNEHPLYKPIHEILRKLCDCDTCIYDSEDPTMWADGTDCAKCLNFFYSFRHTHINDFYYVPNSNQKHIPLIESLIEYLKENTLEKS